MGGATKFTTLLTTPFPPLLRRFSSLSSTPLRLLSLSSPSRTKTLTPHLVNSFHSQPNNNNNTYALQSSSAVHQQRHHPWPEWTNFLSLLSNDDCRIEQEDAFVVYEELSDDFVRAAAACIAFARDRPNLLGLLSRRDIEAVVSNGTPFLFKSALDTARRMRAFLGVDGSNVSESDKANTIDLMKYILSYVSNPTVSPERNGLFSRELVDSSVRNLLHELGTASSGVQAGYMPTSGHQFSGRDGRIQRPFGQNIEMKRGDWICPKCNFMNFAKNMKCLECEESRPKKQLSGGEWECPECNFYNYGRNLVCLRCDCRRPGTPLFNNDNSQFRSGYNGDYSLKTNLDNRLTENEEKAQGWFSRNSQLNHETGINTSIPGSTNSSRAPFVPLPTFPNRDQTSLINDGRTSEVSNQTDTHNKEEQVEKTEKWFKKMAELHNVKDLPSAVSDEDFPEIMPIRKGENRFVVSKKKDRSLTSPKYKRQVAMDQANNSNFVPFVPFPPGYFDKKDTKQSNGQDSPTPDISTVLREGTIPMSVVNSRFSSQNEDDMREVPRIHNNQPMSSTSQISSDNVTSSGGSSIISSQLPKNEYAQSSWAGKSLEGSAVKESDPLDMSEEAKTERWFKRVAQIKDISELSQIPDEDFPSIMPMRKGVNRFVVSKRKTPLERRLTSQQYRRNLPIVSTDSVKKESDNS